MFFMKFKKIKTSLVFKLEYINFVKSYERKFYTNNQYSCFNKQIIPACISSSPLGVYFFWNLGVSGFIFNQNSILNFNQIFQ